VERHSKLVEKVLSGNTVKTFGPIFENPTLFPAKKVEKFKLTFWFATAKAPDRRNFLRSNHFF
jgi:hypothetical protein